MSDAGPRHRKLHLAGEIARIHRAIINGCPLGWSAEHLLRLDAKFRPLVSTYLSCRIHAQLKALASEPVSSARIGIGCFSHGGPQNIPLRNKNTTTGQKSSPRINYRRNPALEDRDQAAEVANDNIGPIGKTDFC